MQRMPATEGKLNGHLCGRMTLMDTAPLQCCTTSTIHVLHTMSTPTPRLQDRVQFQAGGQTKQKCGDGKGDTRVEETTCQPEALCCCESGLPTPNAIDQQHIHLAFCYGDVYGLGGGCGLPCRPEIRRHRWRRTDKNRRRPIGTSAAD